MKFEVVINLINEESFDDFGEALKFFIKRLKEITVPGMSLNILTNCCFVELVKEPVGQVLHTHEVFKAAHELGLMTNAELVDPLPRISDSHVEAVFFAAHTNQIESAVDAWIDAMAAKLSGGDPLEIESIRRRLKGFHD